jgi:ATP/maltotriose-dependent transcriptional regulator MalT
MEVAYYALADALPGLYLIALAPAGWNESELAGNPGLVAGAEVTPLTERELEVLELAADGHSAPMIAAELVVSITTVRTHFAHIYEKLDVRDRAAAVAKAMRIGLIA